MILLWLPDPTLTPDKSCSAWRNTDSQWVSPTGPWKFKIGLGEYNPKVGPCTVKLEIQTHYVTAGWHKHEKVVETERIFKAAGIQSKVPYFLLPGLKDIIKQADLKINIDKAIHLQPAHGKSYFELEYKKNHDNIFEVSGVVPLHAKKGDVILVNLIAHYNGKEKITAKSVGFLAVLHVID